MYNDLRENWSYNEWPEVDLNGNVIEKRSLKESVGISPKRRRVVVDGQEKFDGSRFIKDLNEDQEKGYDITAKSTKTGKTKTLTILAKSEDEARKKFMNAFAKHKPEIVNIKPAKHLSDKEKSADIQKNIDTFVKALGESVCPDCGKKVCECGELKECGEVNEDLLNAKVSPKRGRVIVDGQTDFDGSKFVKDLNEAKKKKDKPENIKDCLMAALEEIEVPEDEELDPKKVLDAIADCLDDEAREYLCGILCPEEKEEEVAEEEPVEVEVEEEPVEDIEAPAEDEVVEEDLTPAEQKEKETIEGPMGVVRHRDESRYNEPVNFEKDKSRKVCGNTVCNSTVSESNLKEDYNEDTITAGKLEFTIFKDYSSESCTLDSECPRITVKDLYDSLIELSDSREDGRDMPTNIDFDITPETTKALETVDEGLLEDVLDRNTDSYSLLGDLETVAQILDEMTPDSLVLTNVLVSAESFDFDDEDEYEDD